MEIEAIPFLSIFRRKEFERVPNKKGTIFFSPTREIRNCGYTRCAATAALDREENAYAFLAWPPFIYQPLCTHEYARQRG